MKHTPGPWTYHEQPFASNGFYIQTVDLSHKKTYIGEVGGGLQQPQEVEANATLIAAAPELLEALIKTVQFLRTQPSVTNCIEDYQIIVNADAIIAKATGEKEVDDV